MNKAVFLILSTLLLTIATSCSSDVPEVNDTGYIDIVSFVNTTNNSTTFQFQQKDDSPVITYEAQDITIDTAYMPRGTRLILAYAPISGEAYKSGYIHVLGMQSILNDNVKIQEIDNNWDEHGIYLYDLWRAGSLINVSCSVIFSEFPARFELVADETTIDNEYPQLYLVHEYTATADESQKAFFASFDMSNVWNKPSCKGVVININDIENNNNRFTLTKQQ